MLAPVVLFVYNRSEQLQQVLNCLNDNAMASDTDLYIFSDEPKREKDIEKVRYNREREKASAEYRKQGNQKTSAGAEGCGLRKLSGVFRRGRDLRSKYQTGNQCLSEGKWVESGRNCRGTDTGKALWIGADAGSGAARAGSALRGDGLLCPARGGSMGDCQALPRKLRGAEADEPRNGGRSSAGDCLQGVKPPVRSPGAATVLFFIAEPRGGWGRACALRLASETRGDRCSLSLRSGDLLEPSVWLWKREEYAVLLRSARARGSRGNCRGSPWTLWTPTPPHRPGTPRTPGTRASQDCSLEMFRYV